MDLDRFDPLASSGPPGFDYSGLTVEELDRLIDHVYSKEISSECEAAIIGMIGLVLSIFQLEHFISKKKFD